MVHLRMKKNLTPSDEICINYNNRVFIPLSNSETGEVDDSTVFCYHQQEDILWAEYSGGQILKGFLIGTVDKDGRLDFCYEHLNLQKELRTGKCNSIPEIMPDGKIRLYEKWQWTNGDCSNGESVIIEK